MHHGLIRTKRFVGVLFFWPDTWGGTPVAPAFQPGRAPLRGGTRRVRCVQMSRRLFSGFVVSQDETSGRDFPLPSSLAHTMVCAGW